MKPEIHPDYLDATVHCSCGNTFVTHSTKADLRVELCSECHPFFTGKQKLVDSGGRVERFQRRYGARKSKAKSTSTSTPTSTSTSTPDKSTSANAEATAGALASDAKVDANSQLD